MFLAGYGEYGGDYGDYGEYGGYGGYSGGYDEGGFWKDGEDSVDHRGFLVWRFEWWSVDEIQKCTSEVARLLKPDKASWYLHTRRGGIGWIQLPWS